MKFSNFLKAVEINPTELCNLRCTFCPRAEGYPNQNLHISLETARIIRSQLDDLDWTGSVVFAGRGEPTLTKDFDKILDIFLDGNPSWFVKVTTNGKRLDSLSRFFNNSKIHFGFDCYTTDRNEFERLRQQYVKYFNIFIAWKPDIGEKFDHPFYETIEKMAHMSNRAGFLAGDKPEKSDDPIQGCQKLTWNMYINWNGDYNLCCDDWTPLVLGNIFDEPIAQFFEHNETLNRYRKQHFLENSREGLPACQNCTRYSLYNNDHEKYQLKYTKFLLENNEEVK